MDVTVLGAGAMGSALTVPLSDNHHAVSLWGSSYDEEILSALRDGEKHPRIGVRLPEEVHLYGPDELGEAIDGCDILVLGVSSGGVVPMSERIVPHLTDQHTLVSIAKGILEYGGKPLLVHEGIREVLRSEGMDSLPPVVCMGGPSIASELAERSRTAVGFASDDQTALEETVEAFETDYFNLKPTSDVRGLETCVGFKNAYSISLAWPTGLGEDSSNKKTNLKAILFLQTIDELERITEAAGGDPETVRGLPGLGDLVTTSSAGRNGTFGKLLGSGMSTDEALGELEDRGVGVIEGYETADLGLERVRAFEEQSDLRLDELPLLQQINRVLYEEGNVEDAVDEIRL